MPGPRKRPAQPRARRPARQPQSRRSRRTPPPSIEGLAEAIVRGGRELLATVDPLEAEGWASSTLGTFYKLDAPWEAREELERALWAAVVARSEAQRDPAGRAVLEALAVVAEGKLATDCLDYTCDYLGDEPFR